MTAFAEIDPTTRRVLQQRGRADPPDFVGPDDPAPTDGPNEWRKLTQDIDWHARPSETHVLLWPIADAAPGWVETAVLADLKTASINRCFPDVDAVVWDAIGNRTEEYKDAETDARAFVAGGYVDPAPESVACYARSNPTGVQQTSQWAADEIIARADAFAAAKLSMRSNRMDRQAEMRAATTVAELDAAVAAWNTFIANTRAQLGLPPA